MGKRKQNQDDLIDLVEKVVASTEEAGEETYAINIKLLRAVLELAKLAPKPRGRQPVKGRDRVQESMAIHAARSRKKKLIADGKPKEKAHEIAAEEAVAKLRSRNLSVATIKRRME